MSTDVYLCPLFNGLAQLSANGALAANANIYTYLAGTTTSANTYTSNTGDTLNPNPIQIGNDGRLPNQIWLPGGQYTKFVMFDQYGVRLDAQDYVIGVDDPAISEGVSQTSAQVSVMNQAYNEANTAFNTANQANIYAQSTLSTMSDVYAAINTAANTTAVYASNVVVANNSKINFVNSSTINVTSAIGGGSLSMANVGFLINLTALGSESLGYANANGWCNLSPNVLMQWGLATGGDEGIALAGKSNPDAPGVANDTITFPKEFLSTVYCVQLSTTIAFGNSPRAVSVNKSSMNVCFEFPGAKVTSNNKYSVIWWLAIGDQG